MEQFEHWAKLEQVEYATIYGHNIWHYKIDSSIGEIHIVDYEAKTMEIKRKLFDYNQHGAEKYFKRVCHQMTDERYL